MKLLKPIILYSSLFICAALAATSCSEENVDNSISYTEKIAESADKLIEYVKLVAEKTDQGHAFQHHLQVRRPDTPFG